MSKKYIIGSWATGAVSVNDVLPVVQDEKLDFEIQGVDSGEINVSKNDLPDPSGWKNYLKVGRKLVLGINDSKNWDDHGQVILGGGYIIRQQARVNDVIRLKLAGPDQYLTQRVISSVLNGEVTNPNTKAINITASSYKDLITLVIKDCFTAKGSGTRPTPPSMPIGYPSTGGGSVAFSCLDSEMMTYSQAISEIQTASPYGNEWRWQWQFTDSSMTQVKLVLTVGGDSSPEDSHINSGSTIAIDLDNDATYKLTGFEQGDNLDGSATRLIIQSKVGDEEAGTGSDYIATVNNVNDVLYDTVLNPGVELTTAQRNEQSSARMPSLANFTGDTLIEVAENISYWIPNLGKTIEISGGSRWNTSGFSTTVRLTKASGSIKEKNCQLQISPIQARYPKLPPKNPFSPNRPGASGGGGIGNGTGRPIVPRLPPNKPVTGGGGPGPTPELPDFDTGPTFETSTPYLVFGRQDTIYPGFGNISEVNYYQNKGNVWAASGSTKNFGSSYRNFASIENLNTQVNEAFPNLVVKFTRINFTSESNNLNTTVPITFNLNNFNLRGIGAAGIAPEFTELINFGSIWNQVNSNFWVEGSVLYIWVYASKQIQQNTSTINGATFGSKIFKYDFTKTNPKWEDTGWDNINENGKLLYPAAQETILAQNGVVYFSGLARIEEIPGSGNLTKSPTLGWDSFTRQGLTYKGYSGKYSAGIYNMNLDNGLMNSISTPGWIIPTISKFNWVPSRPNENEIIFPKLQTLVKDGSGNDPRIGIILHQTTGLRNFPTTNSWNETSIEIAVAYLNLNSFTTQIANNKVSNKDMYSYIVFGNNKGMLFMQENSTSTKTNYVIRTKNGSGEWIKSSPETVGTVSVRDAVSLQNIFGGRQLEFKLPIMATIQPSSPMFTYNGYWLYMYGGVSNYVVNRGHFSS